MAERDKDEIPAWEPGWDGHALAQQRRLARLTLNEKLMWLEEAQRLAQQLARSASERGVSPRPETTEADSTGE